MLHQIDFEAASLRPEAHAAVGAHKLELVSTDLVVFVLETKRARRATERQGAAFSGMQSTPVKNHLIHVACPSGQIEASRDGPSVSCP